MTQSPAWSSKEKVEWKGLGEMDGMEIKESHHVHNGTCEIFIDLDSKES